MGERGQIFGLSCAFHLVSCGMCHVSSVVLLVSCVVLLAGPNWSSWDTNYNVDELFDKFLFFNIQGILEMFNLS